jgi:hypothetical protein
MCSQLYGGQQEPGCRARRGNTGSRERAAALSKRLTKKVLTLPHGLPGTAVPASR